MKTIKLLMILIVMATAVDFAEAKTVNNNVAAATVNAVTENYQLRLPPPPPRPRLFQRRYHRRVVVVRRSYRRPYYRHHYRRY